jgi:esterase/lipase superfamily enzyme
MELLIFGHSGAKVLMFPTRDGRFWEYEKLDVVARLADKVDAGHLQLYCIEGLARETFYDSRRHPADRIRRHAAFEDYILEEVFPLMSGTNSHDCTMAMGCSLGAFQAASLVFRHPHLFRKLVAFSGRYDLTMKVECFEEPVRRLLRRRHLFPYPDAFPARPSLPMAAGKAAPARHRLGRRQGRPFPRQQPLPQPPP